MSKRLKKKRKNKKAPDIIIVSSSNSNTESALREGFDKAVELFRENDKLLSSRVFTIATGGLAFSFTVISFLVEDRKDLASWPTLIIWLGFLICIVWDTISVYKARESGRALSEIFGEKIKKGENLSSNEINKIIKDNNQKTRDFNNQIYILLFLDILATLFYVLYLIYS